MIDRVIEFSIRNRTLVIAAGLLLAVWGVVALIQTPIDAIPDLSENQVIVFTDWLGHSPREIEDQITYPLSLSLQGLAGVQIVRSSSDFNFSSISVIFDESLNFSVARQRVAERLAGLGDRLPAGVTPQLAPESLATGQIFWYTIEGVGFDLGRLRAIQDWYVRPQLASVPGVAEVASVGGFPIEFQIEVDPNRLRSYGVTMTDVVHAVSRSNSAVGGHVVQKANAEYIVRGIGRLGAAAGQPDGEIDAKQVLQDIERISIGVRTSASAGSERPEFSEGEARERQTAERSLESARANPPTASNTQTSLQVSDIATVSLGGQPRRGVLEKDGNEVTGGVVLMRFGENPLEVTRRVKDKIAKLEPGLPTHVRIVPGYDRTPLIKGAIRTVTGTLIEAIITASICVLIVLLHFRTSFIIAITLPLATLTSFVIMWTLRRLGVTDIQTNIMSLAGIAISIGVLVDSSIVMAENVMHSLKQHFGDRPVKGDVRWLVLPACRTVGRPIFFSVLIMLISFVPVFALGGMEGKMFRPLAFTKSFALAAVAVLATTLVPALCTIFIKGRLRSDSESWLVRSCSEVYRPVLNYLFDHPSVMAWIMSVTFVVGLAPIGSRWVFLASVFLAIVACGLTARGWRGRVAALASILLIALVADQNMTPLGREFMTPLDEGIVMDMPITVPRASVNQSADDLKARDMILCRFPEVEMVMGKAGRAETSTDPAPMDMIETMVSFRPTELWPRRRILVADARRQCRAIFDSLIKGGLIEPIDDRSRLDTVVDESVSDALAQFDNVMREVAYLKNQQFTEQLARGRVASASQPPAESVNQQRQRWREHMQQLNGELLDRAAATFTRTVTDQLLARATVKDSGLAGMLAEQKRLRSTAVPLKPTPAVHHASSAVAPAADPYPPLDSIRNESARQLSKRLVLWPHERWTLAGFGSEMDRVMQMPGWTNVWTMPIQNRVDMLATGVNTAIGVRVLGGNVDSVVRTSEEIAAVLKRLPGAADVVADPTRGKGYVEVRPDRDSLARFGITVDDVNDVVETALGGKVATTVVAGRARHAVRVRYARDWRTDDDALKNLLVPVPWQPDGLESSGRGPSQDGDLPSVRHTSDSTGAENATAGRGQPERRGNGDRAWAHIPLDQVADVRVVEGPATIKSENGLLRNYVRLNVRGRGVVDFVEEARQVVAEQVKLPQGVFVEWVGQFEHQMRARNTLLVVVPLVIAIIFVILYLTYRDWADAVLMMLAVPGAIAGGVLFQWLLNYRFSVTVWIGYIACFGMATSTGIIMLVYLREAVERAGGLNSITLAGLRQAVMDGAVHRLRPKLLTEGTTIIGLAPMLWATGPGAEVIKPMAAPVLGGILIADEVIDLFLPVLFYWVRRWRWERLHAGRMISPPGEISESSENSAAVPSSEAPNRLAEVGLIHSSFQTVGRAKEYGDETIEG